MPSDTHAASAEQEHFSTPVHNNNTPKTTLSRILHQQETYNNTHPPSPTLFTNDVSKE
jgi:hypothetical protein